MSLEELDLINENVKVESPKGAMHLAINCVYNACIVPSPKIEKRGSGYVKKYSHIHQFYKESLLFLEEGKLLPMVADCMGYDVKKFRQAALDTLEKNYSIYRGNKDYTI